MGQVAYKVSCLSSCTLSDLSLYSPSSAKLQEALARNSVCSVDFLPIQTCESK